VGSLAVMTKILPVLLLSTLAAIGCDRRPITYEAAPSDLTPRNNNCPPPEGCVNVTDGVLCPCVLVKDEQGNLIWGECKAPCDEPLVEHEVIVDGKKDIVYSGCGVCYDAAGGELSECPCLEPCEEVLDAEGHTLIKCCDSCWEPTGKPVYCP